MALVEEAYTVEHSSAYEYSVERTSCIMMLRLKPITNGMQRVEAFDLIVEPLTQPLEFEDFLGNTCHLINIHRPHKELQIRSRSLVFVQTPASSEDVPGFAQKHFEEMGGTGDLWDYEQPTENTNWVAGLDTFLQQHSLERSDHVESSLRALEQAIHKGLSYVPASTTIDTTIEQVLAQGEGVCQDFAHLMIAVARRWGIPSRYVMGYLCPKEHHLEKTQESHAWVECLIPEKGWVRFDPTNPARRGRGYITVACGRDFKDVSPTKGLNMGVGNEELQVEVTVSPL